MAAVVGLVKDLLDRSRIQGMARAVGSRVDFVSSIEELERADISEVTAVFVDLTDKDLHGVRAPDVVARISQGKRPTIIGFIAHHDKDGISKAEEAGFDEVLTRAAFFRRLSVLLAEARERFSGQSHRGGACPKDE